MKVFRAAETDPKQHRDLARATFAARRVVECGVAALPPGHVAHADEDHRHEHTEVFFVLAGDVVLPQADGREDPASAGDWIRVDPGCEHHLTNRSESPAQVIYMMLTGEGE